MKIPLHPLIPKGDALLDTGTKFQRESLVVEAIPYWKYWSIKQKVT